MNAEQVISGQPRAHRGTGGEWTILCPWHQEHSPSCCVNVDKKVFICHGCGEKGRLTKLIARLQNITWNEAARIADEAVHFYSKEIESGKIQLPKEFSRLPRGGHFGQIAMSYLAGRRITQEQVVRHGIGFCITGKYAFRIIVPIRLNGALVSFVARDFTGKAERKVRYPIGARAAEAIFNYDAALAHAKTVVITEGWADALAVERVIQRDGVLNSWTATAIGGKELTIEKRELFRQFKNFLIVLDRDAAREAALMREQLDAFRNVAVRIVSVTAKDPAEESEESLITLLR